MLICAKDCRKAEFTSKDIHGSILIWEISLKANELFYISSDPLILFTTFCMIAIASHIL